MRFTVRHSGAMSWTARAVVAAMLAGGSAAGTVGIAAAAHAQVRAPNPSAVVVQAASRMGFGKILVTVKVGHALYIHPHGSCDSSCRSVWPPLLMPAGKTKPKGASCLATAKLGKKLQVTYHGQRLYTFTGDSGHSVNGNGVGGFVVAKVTMACP